jgi:peptidoglycan/LPS O-acetylase OafA/YrhL
MIDESAAAPPESEEAASTAAYRPHLDGLRAVAVYLVVLFHAGSKRFPGGYVGVDVFFVLSGFLVTQLLLRDINRRGSIRLSRFYARRFRRLLPAAFVTLIVTAIVFSAIASPVELANTVGSFKAAFLYSTNWYFIHQSTNYFGAGLDTNPVLQFWSLAVEEQFYLVWPLLLGGVFVWTRRLGPARQMRAIRIGVAVAAIASAVWALSLQGANPNRAYYGTDARAYELLAGALLALAPTFIASAVRYRRSMRVATVASIAALVVIASSVIHLNAIARGIVVTITTCVIIVAIEAADGGLVKRGLSSAPVVYLGKISYGTYLWHWLIILFIVRQLHLSTPSTIAIACVVATAFASLSFEILERPVRVSHLLDGHRRAVIAAGLAISVISALVLIPKIVNPAKASATAVSSSTKIGFTPVPANLDMSTAANGFRIPNCFHRPAADCVLVHGRGQRILLMGDSHAAMYIPTLTAIARREHLTLAVATRGLCPWQQNLYAPASEIAQLTAGGASGISADGCKAYRDDLYARVLPALRPDIIVAADIDDTYATPEAATSASVTQLAHDGHKVVLIEDIPKAPSDPIECLSKAKVLEECRYVANPTPTPAELSYRQAATVVPGVFSADFDHLVCPFLPICDPIVNGQIVKWDPTHLTVGFAKTIAPQVDAYLKQTVLKSP